MAELIIKRVPGHFWVRPFVVWGGEFEPGRGWLYNCIRRDAWQIGPLGFGLMRMPYARHLPADLRAKHGLSGADAPKAETPEEVADVSRD